MTTLKHLRFSILMACFLNLVFALTHWSGISHSHILSDTNYGLSLLIIMLVLTSTIVLTHHPEVDLPRRQQIWLLNFAALLIAFLTEWL